MTSPPPIGGDSPQSHISPISAWSPQPYETEYDLQQIQDLLMHARSRTDDWRYPHIGDLMWDFFILFCHLHPQEHTRLWRNDRGELAGYAILNEEPAFDFQVLPEYEWAGIETEAIAWIETRLAELRKEDAARWNGALNILVRRDHAKRMAFLEQHGFQRGEHIELNLLRALDAPISEPALPAGCQIRAVVDAEEAPARADIQREVWHPWSVSKVSGDDYARLMRLPAYHRELDLVAIAADGVIASYVNGWIDPVNRIGALGPVGARPAYRRQGLTRATLLEALRRLQARGMNRVCISTGISNTPARRLYESVGFEVVNEQHLYAKPARN